MNFPWETSTQASNSFAQSGRIRSGPMAGRYTQKRSDRPDNKPYQRTPAPPVSILDHPKGKREWEQYNERVVPTILPPRDTGSEPLIAHPLSSAHSRLLPAGRSHTVQMHDDPKQSQRMKVPRRKDQGNSMLLPDPTAPAPALLTRMDGRGDVRSYPKKPKTYVTEPRYNPVTHNFAANKQPFLSKAEEYRADGVQKPDAFGKTNPIVPVFAHQVTRRVNQQIVPDAARGISTYGHLRHEDSKFLDFNEFHTKGSFLNNKAYSHSRHFNLGGQGVKGSMGEEVDHTNGNKNFKMHQMDHMKKALESGGLGEHSFGMKDVIPDGQTNQFVTKAGTVSDWAISGDAPEWIVAQARRSDPSGNSVLKRQNDFVPDDGQINEFSVGDNVSGFASDW